jgi:lysylphosphatidylglycerol synthetase-like protein (DUF2156 family)
MVMDAPPQDEPPTSAPPRTPAPPARAFTQGVGTVFQFIGVSLFLGSFFVCCGSSLISRDRATHTDLTRVGWSISGNVRYSAQQALTISLLAAVFFGLALAGLGLGLQAQSRRAPALAVLVTTIAVLFWITHGLFFALEARSTFLSLTCLILGALFALLLAISMAALREMRATPPPPGFGVLPADFKVPYSHMHQDPPEIRLAREVEQRRQRLAVQQKELEMLEEKLKRKLQHTDD